MKKTIFTILALAFFCAGAFAQQGNNKAAKTIMMRQFEKLVVDGNMTVLLRESDHFSLEVKGTPAFVKSFQTRQGNNGMVLRSYYDSYGKTENIVIVSAKNLKEIFVCGEASVYSENTLASPVLNVWLDAEARVRINSFGKLNVFASDSYVINR